MERQPCRGQGTGSTAMGRQARKTRLQSLGPGVWDDQEEPGQGPGLDGPGREGLAEVTQSPFHEEMQKPTLLCPLPREVPPSWSTCQGPPGSPSFFLH